MKGPDGNPISGATIQLYDVSSGRKYSSKTNGKGEYLFGVVYMGTYKGTLIVNGRPVDEKSSIGIGAGQEQVVDWNEGGGNTLTEEQKQRLPLRREKTPR